MTTLIAFLLQVMLPFFAIYSVPANAQAVPSVLGDKILICTADGFEWLTAKELAELPETPENHPDFSCAMCYVSAHAMGDTPPTSGILLSDVPAEYRRIQVASGAILPTYNRSLAHLTRAPPVF